MLEHQLPALLPVATFWDALPEIFAWLAGAVPSPSRRCRLAPMTRLIRDRIIDFPAGGRGQSFIEMIRFAAANRLLVEIDYRDKQGNRSMRAIEAYSLRRSQAGDVLLMAARADNGQPRSYLVDNILGARPTQTPFSPRYPIELTPSGPQASHKGRFGLVELWGRLAVIRRRPPVGQHAAATFGSKRPDLRL